MIEYYYCEECDEKWTDDEIEVDSTSTSDLGYLIFYICPKCDNIIKSEKHEFED